MKIQVIQTPGHTIGGCCYYIADEQTLFSGDTLFAGSCGRVDLPGGSAAEMRRSLSMLAKLPLPGETKVMPGHEYFSTLGEERRRRLRGRRDLAHEPVVAVEVEKTATPAILPKKGLLEGITITYSVSKCDEIGCPNYGLCHPVGKTEGSKYSVSRMGKDVECPRGDRLVAVDLL